MKVEAYIHSLKDTVHNHRALGEDDTFQCIELIENPRYSVKTTQ